MDIIGSHYNSNVPIMLQKPGNQGYKSTKMLTQIKETLDFIREAYFQTNDKEILDQYKRYKGFYLKYARWERKNQNQKKIMLASNKQKMTWTLINEETGRRKNHSNNPPPAEMLNKYFTTIASTIIADIPNVERSAGSYLKERKNFKSLFFRPIVEGDIFKYIQKMAPKSTQDIFEMNTVVVKSIMEFISRVTNLSHPTHRLECLKELGNILKENPYPLKSINKLLFSSNQKPGLSGMSSVEPIVRNKDDDSSNDELSPEQDSCSYRTLSYIEELTSRLSNVFGSDNVRIAKKHIKTISTLFTRAKTPLTL
ncbi:hypothetical protein WA026_015362 [Henosepilachna vigintioctopunctata]|uniref:Uncharacterized protein n=1 Tax=Henosepilachna vigintioctopunctata TaxID=420089 RepID=A0AAW1UKL2_9CUCU